MAKVTRPDWQDWPEEPWTTELMDGGSLRWPHRAVACVNDLAGIRNPAAVKDVIEAADDLVSDIRAFLGEAWPDELEAAIRRAETALAALDQEPGE